MYLASKAIEFSKKRKKRLLRCSRSFKVEVGTIESPYVTSYWCLIVNDNLSHTAAELSQLTDWSNFGHFVFFEPPNWTFFLRCYSWGAAGESRSKISDFASTWSVWPKISGRRGCPSPIVFAWIVGPIHALQLCCWQFSHKKNFVADFLQVKCDFRGKMAVLRFWAPFGGLRGKVRWSY